MAVSVSEQLMQAAAALLVGGGLGLLYDVFRALRRRLRLAVLTDLLFWVCAAAALFTLGLAGPGSARLFELACAGLGAALYFSLLSAAVLTGLDFLLGLLGRALRFLLRPLARLPGFLGKSKNFFKNIFKK
jgi:spore cortex biosynthesis protein YabQ